MEFKVNNDKTGQIRVYLLHNHLIHREAAKRKKEIEKATKHLMREVDIANNTWAGNWSQEIPVLYIHPALNQTDSTQDETLLDIYNSLPSPKPCPEEVSDYYSCQAMEMLLKNDVHGLITTLYPYQRSSAAAMLQREISPGQIIDPRLIKLVDQRGKIWYCDPDEGYTNHEPRMYEGARGGILAENMGLGKTLICLSLILATRDIYSTIPPQYSVGLIPTREATGSLLEMAASALGRHGVPWKIRFALAEDDGYEMKAPRKAIRDQPGYYVHAPGTPSRSTRSLRAPSEKIFLSTTTLVVVPPNLIQQWLDEIKKHTRGLKVISLASSRDVLPSAVELLDYDIVLFTKTRFDKEGKDLENSPLVKIHFKRLIFDEGHTVGNSSAGSQTDSFKLIESLKLTARWIVSGTPTPGLYSTEESSANTPTTSDPVKLTNLDERQNITYDPKPVSRPDLIQERKDLMKLGNITKYFLKARPWAPSSDGDNAEWQQYVLQARHGSKSRGSAACLRTTLEGIMIKHRLSDVEKNVVLPPLNQSIVKLEPCLLDKLTLNLFNIMVITNAVASERKDVDYFFHPTQRKSLQSLVSNLREGSFFWSGFEVAHVKSTVDNAQTYLDKEEKVASAEDIALLQQVVSMGRSIVSNNIFEQICRWHDIPLFVENEFPEHLRRALSLDKSSENPTLMGASMLFDAQKFVHDNPTTINFVDGLIIAAQKSFKNAEKASESHSARSGRMQDARLDDSKGNKLAGGVTTGMEFIPKKRNKASTQTSSLKLTQNVGLSESSSTIVPRLLSGQSGTDNDDLSESHKGEISAAEASNGMDHLSQLDTARFLQSSRLMSTASAKLSYLLDRIVVHQKTEKILVFYESDNVGWYLAQCLECLDIKHLIYSKGLKSEQRARYVVTFNRTEKFRVLLMDVSQAAYGLDMSSASRVYFINPVFSPQVEAQAVKRAHRIGQLKPVYVETLVLSGSIEEVIVDRRGLISNEEHQKYKSILDDQTVYNWIRNLKLLPMVLDDVPGPDQMAPLATPQRVFVHGSGAALDPDAEILMIENYDAMDEPSSPIISPKIYIEEDLRALRIALRGNLGGGPILAGLRLFLSKKSDELDAWKSASQVAPQFENNAKARARRRANVISTPLVFGSSFDRMSNHSGSQNQSSIPGHGNDQDRPGQGQSSLTPTIDHRSAQRGRTAGQPMPSMRAYTPINPASLFGAANSQYSTMLGNRVADGDLDRALDSGQRSSRSTEVRFGRAPGLSTQLDFDDDLPDNFGSLLANTDSPNPRDGNMTSDRALATEQNPHRYSDRPLTPAERHRAILGESMSAMRAMPPDYRSVHAAGAGRLPNFHSGGPFTEEQLYRDFMAASDSLLVDANSSNLRASTAELDRALASEQTSRPPAVNSYRRSRHRAFQQDVDEEYDEEDMEGYTVYTAQMGQDPGRRPAGEQGRDYY